MANSEYIVVEMSLFIVILLIILNLMISSDWSMLYKLKSSNETNLHNYILIDRVPIELWLL